MKFAKYALVALLGVMGSLSAQWVQVSEKQEVEKSGLYNGDLKKEIIYFYNPSTKSEDIPVKALVTEIIDVITKEIKVVLYDIRMELKDAEYTLTDSVTSDVLSKGGPISYQIEAKDIAGQTIKNRKNLILIDLGGLYKTLMKTRYGEWPFMGSAYKH